MAGNSYYQEYLNLRCKNSYPALQKMVAAAAKSVRHHGKKTLFGRKDKGLIAYHGFLKSLHEALLALEADGFITDQSSPEEMREQVVSLLNKFKMTHPNWQDAYTFFDYFFSTEDLSFDSVKIISGFCD